MREAHNAPAAEERTYGTVELNDRDRLTIPKRLRDALNLEAGPEFPAVREGRDIRLIRKLPDQETLARGGTRGEATFGGGR